MAYKPPSKRLNPLKLQNQQTLIDFLMPSNKKLLKNIELNEMETQLEPKIK